MAELLAGIDAVAIAEGWRAPAQAVLLVDLRSEAYDELALVTKEFAGCAGVTLPVAGLEGSVTIDHSIRAIASLASALCRLLDQATSTQT